MKRLHSGGVFISGSFLRSTAKSRQNCLQDHPRANRVVVAFINHDESARASVLQVGVDE